MISGYHNSAAKRDIVRLVLKLHNYDADTLQSVSEKSFPQSARPTEIQREIMRMHDSCAWQSV